MPRHPPCALCSLSHKHSTKTTKQPHQQTAGHLAASIAVRTTQHKRPDKNTRHPPHGEPACIPSIALHLLQQATTTITTRPPPRPAVPDAIRYLQLADARVHCSTTKHHTHQHPHHTNRCSFSEGGSPKTEGPGAKNRVIPQNPNSVPKPSPRTSRPGSTPTHPQEERVSSTEADHPTQDSRSSTIPLASSTTGPDEVVWTLMATDSLERR